MIISNDPQFPLDAMLGESPHVFFGIDAPDGDASPWFEKPRGTLYGYRNDSNGAVRWYEKVKDDGENNDWALGLLVISETVEVADFTDGGGASGTYTLSQQIPAGAFALRGVVVDLTGFTGNTSAVITVGDGTDVDRYNAGTPSVFTTAAAVDLGAPSGTQIHTAAANIVITITGNSDFGAIAAGKLTFRLYCLA